MLQPNKLVFVPVKF